MTSGALGCVLVQAGKAPLDVKDQGTTDPKEHRRLGESDPILVSELVASVLHFCQWHIGSCTILRASVIGVPLVALLARLMLLALLSRSGDRQVIQRHFQS